MATTYEEIIAAAGDLWIGSDITDVTERNPEYINGQEQTISSAFNVPVEKVHEDILNAAGIYRPIEWDGVRVALIESQTSPWVEDEAGNVFDFGGEGFRSLTSGVLVSGTEIQRDDAAAMVDDFTDLHAARIAAAEVTRITGRVHVVKFNGTY
ncbi:hypothetical protein SEA_A3WALLY_367 [Microbacterium phage A3Wally]|nr:hypothetical protein SEA_A3WALLY_14 [Microbacterium phage A3Wally]QWY84174.1 hypothetical protein SEA_A3WALLY_367 [Microbacterium phage A3Wally]